VKMETPLARVRGLGAAGHGGADWWAVRLNSVALLLLSVWLLVSLLRLPQVDYATVNEWLREPLAAVPMLLLVATTFWHIQKGLREVIDDYTHNEGNRVALITLLAFFVYGGGLFAAFCVVKIAFGGSAA
jgi:succinate dehydrogenase / fumarate reductase, membrane anchor subunit